MINTFVTDKGPQSNGQCPDLVLRSDSSWVDVRIGLPDYPARYYGEKMAKYAGHNPHPLILSPECQVYNGSLPHFESIITSPKTRRYVYAMIGHIMCRYRTLAVNQYGLITEEIKLNRLEDTTRGMSEMLQSITNPPTYHPALDRR